MNVSRAYFSDRMFLNHAAINPAFNFLYLLNKNDDFESQYQFYDKDVAIPVFEKLSEQPEGAVRPSLLRFDRPNIILFILESFSFDVAIDTVVAPNMARFAKEGVLFENFYANTFRTDRGLASILSGYPAHPTTAILKYPKKTDRLPAFPTYLRANGYENQSLYYGGDVNFANMRSYFVGSCGIQDIVSDKDFPIKERLSKWGAPDKQLVDRVYRDLSETKQDEPFLKIILTLSSHEPFEVPTKKIDVPYLNAVNYADECIGRFVSDLKSTDLWDNTLIIFISDHAMQGYPQGTNNFEAVRFHIPMIWIGGAVEQPAVISDYGSQNDLAATLLSQLQIDHADFIFSKDMLHPQGRKFAFYSYVNGFCMMDSSSVYLYDNNQQRTLKQAGDPTMEKEAKAFFQMMYLDLGSR
jgi:phosphoglycerol transferase MdoB-like AlkP superfamily enzyme